MLKQYLLLGGLLISQAAAYPWMAPGYDGPNLSEKDVDHAWKLYERYKENNERADNKKRILGLGETLGNVVGSVGGLLDGLLGGIAQNINPSDQRPDAAHPFQAPGPSDQRGPCPGLNTLANHGYLPRSGIVTAGEVIEATAEGFNMGADLSGLLVFIAVAFGGNIESSTFSLGGEDDRTYSAAGVGSREAGRQYGLAGHSRCEGDISAMRRDYYLNNGDNHNAYPDRFKRFIELAKENGGEFNLAAANALYGENARESVANNDQLFFNSYTIVVVLGEYPFIPGFFSNGTYGAGGVANYESISSFYGMSMNEDGTICYVPERFPGNWYRRSVPYGVVDLIAGLPGTYLSGPVLPNPVGILQNPAQAPNIGCALYQGLTSGIPAGLLGSTNDFISDAVTYLQNKLLPGLPDVYGCKPDQPSLQANGSGGEQYSIPSGGTNGYNICA